MKKKGIFIILLISLSRLVTAQESPVPDLAALNSAAKNPYVKVESLDKLQQDLGYFNEHPVHGKEQQQMLLDTYRSIANGYSVNNHYKQGYGIYQKYLDLKERFLTAEKTEAVSSLVHGLEEKQSKDENELVSKQNEIQQLELDNKYLDAQRKAFKQYFSFGVIALTVLFSFLLLQAGLKLNKIRNDLKTGRDRLKTIHRYATLGRLKSGLMHMMGHQFTDMKKEVDSCLMKVDEVSQATNIKAAEFNSLRKSLTELKQMCDQPI